MEHHEWDPMRPRWVQIAETIRARIGDGTYPPRMPLPEGRIMEEWGVARNTARRAIRELSDEGLMVVVPRWGSFVAEREG